MCCLGLLGLHPQNRVSLGFLLNFSKQLLVVSPCSETKSSSFLLNGIRGKNLDFLQYLSIYDVVLPLFDHVGGTLLLNHRPFQLKGMKC